MAKMNCKSRIRSLLALLLAALMLSSACRVSTPPTTDPPATDVPATDVPATDVPATDAPATALPDIASVQAPVRLKNGRPIEVPILSEIPYTRPDLDKILADYDALAAKAKTGLDAADLIKGFTELEGINEHISTLRTLAMFRYNIDMSDTFYRDEMDFCEECAYQLYNKQCELLAAFAASPARAELNRYFDANYGYNYLNYFSDYTPPKPGEYNFSASDPWDIEYELQDRYDELTGAPLVSYMGETKYLLEWKDSDSFEVQDGAYSAYIEQYHDAVGELFLEMIRNRRQMAIQSDFADYNQYSLYEYGRSFSEDDERAFLSYVKKHLVPLIDALYEKDPDTRCRYSDVVDADPIKLLYGAAENMGGVISEACRFMLAYKLYDISASPTKKRTSYMTYINEYEAPIIFVNPVEHKDFLSTISHEFGHFTDNYYNYNGYSETELRETFSHSMVYLVMSNLQGLSEQDRADAVRTSLLELLLTRIAERSAYAEFELQVYAIDPDDLTLDKLDAIWDQCRKDYGLRLPYPDEIKPMSWVKDLYFFTYPGYVISYPTSAAAALEICGIEAETPGAGAAKFCELLDHSTRGTFEEALFAASLGSPFEESTIKRIADFLKTALDLG